MEVSEHPQARRHAFHLNNEEAMNFALHDLDIFSCATYQKAEAWANNVPGGEGQQTTRKAGDYAPQFALYKGEKKKKAGGKKAGCYVISDFGPDYRSLGPPRQRIFKDWESARLFTDGFSATQYRAVRGSQTKSCWQLALQLLTQAGIPVDWEAEVDVPENIKKDLERGDGVEDDLGSVTDTTLSPPPGTNGDLLAGAGQEMHTVEHFDKGKGMAEGQGQDETQIYQEDIITDTNSLLCACGCGKTIPLSASDELGMILCSNNVSAMTITCAGDRFGRDIRLQNIPCGCGTSADCGFMRDSWSSKMRLAKQNKETEDLRAHLLATTTAMQADSMMLQRELDYVKRKTKDLDEVLDPLSKTVVVTTVKGFVVLFADKDNCKSTLDRIAQKVYGRFFADNKPTSMWFGPARDHKMEDSKVIHQRLLHVAFEDPELAVQFVAAHAPGISGRSVAPSMLTVPMPPNSLSPSP